MSLVILFFKLWLPVVAVCAVVSAVTALVFIFFMR
jgi:hypothetical protein